MRIALVVPEVRPDGGQDRYALELVNRLAVRHDVSLFAQKGVGVQPAVHFTRIAAPRRPSSLRDLVFRLRAKSRMRGQAWDIVHTIGGCLPGANVITAQYCHAGHLMSEKRWPSELHGRVGAALRPGLAKVAERDERKAAAHPALRALIAVSRRTANEWRDWYHPRVRIEAVIPNGVDAERFRPGSPELQSQLRDRLGLPADEPILLTVGALIRKGIETTMRVVADLPQQAHLVAVGDGPHERIQEIAVALGLAGRLHLRRPTPEIEQYFQASDAFLFPTRYEPFGMVVAEAWACGIPVITSRVTGAVEWATPDRDALIVRDPTDVTALAEATSRVLGDDALAQTLGANGRELALTLTWERVVSETEAVYHKVVEA
jgi:glycosyltransferase involved in cell wall biosynthesis